MDLNIAALIAAIAALAGVVGHGVLGGAWLSAQLRSAPMSPTPISKRLFGDRDVAWAIFNVTWHTVTLFFAIAAGAFLLTAFGALESRDLMRFLAIVFAAILVLGATIAFTYIGGSVDAVIKPIPLLFTAGMTVASAFAWIASDSL